MRKISVALVIIFNTLLLPQIISHVYAEEALSAVTEADKEAGAGPVKKQIRSKSVASILAEQDPRGASELTLCSQNLNNLGDFALTRQRLDNSMTQADFDAKVAALVSRFVRGKCDVIAVQELLGTTSEAALKNIDQLASALQFRTGRIFEARVGNTNDPISRVGFLVASDRAEILAETSYNRVELPKITAKERPRFFLRGPLELQLSIKGRDGSAAKIMAVINLHLKSKGGRERDPAELEWETYRMQMAEAVRRIVESRHERAFASGETLLAIVGDRNSNFDAASSDILSGRLVLSDFKAQGGCRVSKRGVAFCQTEKYRPTRLFSVLQGDPQTSLLPGTFRMNKVYSWLDEILLPQESLRFAWSTFSKEGDYTSFVMNDHPKASDHSLVGVTFNW